MKDWKKVERQDNQFWDAVKGSMFDIFRLIGVTDRRNWVQNTYTGDMRIVACPKVTGAPEQGIYDFFSASPDCFVPDGRFLIDMWTEVPAAFKKRDLLVVLWKLVGGQRNEMVSETCRHLDKIFQQEAVANSEENAADWFQDHPKEIRDAKLQLEELYRQWFKYVARHYNKTLKGTDDESKKRYQIRLIEGKRNQEIRAEGPSLDEAIKTLRLMDDTLCWHLPSGDREACVGLSVTKDSLRRWMEEYQFPAKYLGEIKKLLRLHQKILCAKCEPILREQAKDPMAHPCFSYVWNGKVYNVYWQKDKKMFSFAMISQTEKRPAVKQILMQKWGEITVPKEYLYALSGGNWDNFGQLAKITAYAVCAEKLFHGAIVVDEYGVPELAAVLEWISGRIEPSIDALAKGNPLLLSSLSKESTKDQFIDMKIDGRLFAVCCDDVNRLNPDQWKRLKKVLSGVSITYRDSILGRKRHRNMMQWFVCGNDLTFQKLAINRIETMRAPVYQVPENVGSVASLWLQLILPMWGFLQLQRKGAAKALPENCMPAVQYFMEHCCCLLSEDNEFLPARELYEHYVDFCQMMRRKDVLKFKDFNDVLENSYGQKRVRYHRTTGENKTGYKRIRFLGVNPSTLQPVPSTPSEREQFFARLEQIADEVKKHFPDWPFAELL